MARSILVTFFMFLLAFASYYYLSGFDECKSVPYALADKIPWAGAIFAASYAALYARFSSQWNYLSSLYNQIKQTEVSCAESANLKIIAAWKAGFIEDSEYLHLSRKDSFVSVIYHWSQCPEVECAYKANTPDGEYRWHKLMSHVVRDYNKLNRAFSD